MIVPFITPASLLVLFPAFETLDAVWAIGAAAAILAAAGHEPYPLQAAPAPHLVTVLAAPALWMLVQVIAGQPNSGERLGRQVESSDLESQLQYGGFIAVRRFHIGVWANDFPCPQCLHDRDPCPPNRPRLGSKKQTRRGKHPMRLFGLTRRRCAD
jgi:hypothetical protein